MRAIVVAAPGGPSALRVGDTPIPAPLPGEVLIRSRLVAVNFADVRRRMGIDMDPLGFPITPGIEGLGDVVAAGDGVSQQLLGTRVAAFASHTVHGSYAEYFTAVERLALRIPKHISDDAAAAFPVVSLTAFHSLVTAARVQAGESVLIAAAAGGVGIAAVQIATILGLRPIIAAAGSLARARVAVGFGATHATDYEEVTLRRVVAEATGNRGVDVILDGVGGGFRARSALCLAPLGRLVHFGDSSGESGAPIPDAAMRSGLCGTVGFSLKALRQAQPELIAPSGDLVMGWIRTGALRIPVQDILPLEAASEAHRRLEERRVLGKLLLEVAP